MDRSLYYTHRDQSYTDCRVLLPALSRRHSYIESKCLRMLWLTWKNSGESFAVLSGWQHWFPAMTSSWWHHLQIASYKIFVKKKKTNKKTSTYNHTLHSVTQMLSIKTLSSIWSSAFANCTDSYQVRVAWLDCVVSRSSYAQWSKELAWTHPFVVVVAGAWLDPRFPFLCLTIYINSVCVPVAKLQAEVSRRMEGLFWLMATERSQSVVAQRVDCLLR